MTKTTKKTRKKTVAKKAAPKTTAKKSSKKRAKKKVSEKKTVKAKSTKKTKSTKVEKINNVINFSEKKSEKENSRITDVFKRDPKEERKLLIEKQAAKKEWLQTINPEDKSTKYSEEQWAEILQFEMFHKNWKLLNNTVSRYESGRYANIFTKEHIQNEAYLAIAYALQAWKQYNKMIDSKIINIKETTKLKTVADLKGYCVNTFKYNIQKIYTKLNRKKRSTYNSMESLDATFSSDSATLKIDYLTPTNSLQDHHDKEHYHRTIKSMLSFLEEKDMEFNESYKNINKVDVVPLQKQSFMAATFLEHLNDENEGKIKRMAESLGVTTYLFNSMRKKMFPLLLKNFKDDAQDALNYIIDKNTRLTNSLKDGSVLIAKRATPKDKFKIHQVLQTKNLKNGKTKLEWVTSVDEHTGKGWTKIKAYVQEKTITNFKMEDLSKYREELVLAGLSDLKMAESDLVTVKESYENNEELEYLETEQAISA